MDQDIASLAFTGYDDHVRGAILIFSRNHELDSVLSTIYNLQRAYDHRLSKHWVFYSDEDISEEFKVLTSNLTLPGKASYEKWVPDGSRGDVREWGLPVLAKDERLRGYNWAWKITPGARFPNKLDFDVFESMKSQRMIYGSESSDLHVGEPGSSDIKSGDTATSIRPPSGLSEFRWSAEAGSPIVLEGKLYNGSPFRFHSNSRKHSSFWVDPVYKLSTIGSDFEIAWLDLFRSTENLIIADYITSFRNTSRTPDPPTSPVSSTVFSFEGVACRKQPEQPASRFGVFYLPGSPENTMLTVYERWAYFSRDFAEQAKEPGLRAGRTTLYAMAELYKLRPKAWMRASGFPARGSCNNKVEGNASVPVFEGDLPPIKDNDDSPFVGSVKVFYLSAFILVLFLYLHSSFKPSDLHSYVTLPRRWWEGASLWFNN
ncbi:uncharacterized protein DNG_01347 [Cephalotrichum gorgonifer]|uniref:Uncharacterized protein n=1 Tax=Cephalotrichum gorgonifer TaxID=2041049 RepID=A0AAE8MSF4_9PEZI|nr:uncharacterized protein DNG_01347 [Cephalotrichum gorgonifer]